MEPAVYKVNHQQCMICRAKLEPVKIGDKLALYCEHCDITFEAEYHMGEYSVITPLGKKLREIENEDRSDPTKNPFLKEE